MRRTQAQIKDAVIVHVRQLLDQVGKRFKFEIVEAGVRQDNEWWYVPVVALTTDGKPLPREFTTNVFANVEEKISTAHRENVLIIPALP